MELFRPTGLLELLLLFRSGMRAWPPRLPDQPIFYPVLNQPYAAQIAREWNTTVDARVGYVTRFTVSEPCAQRYAAQTVGDRSHRELWVPAEELGAFNGEIQGQIEVCDAFFGEGFVGVRPEHGALAGLDARAQWPALAALSAGDERVFASEIAAQRECIFAHWRLWASLDPSGADLRARIATVWTAVEAVPLPAV